MGETAKLVLEGKEFEFPIIEGTENEINAYFEVWYSDYKSASSVERVEAFIKLGRPDPVPYADETGPVSWETVRSHVEQVILNHTK